MTGVLEEQWLSMYLQLVDFKNKNGHANVPARYEVFKSLGYWVRRQRLVYHGGKIDPLREKLLLLVGFNFRLSEFHDWDKMYDKLLDFKKQSGHVRVTQSCQHPQLHNWLIYQRKLYWKGKLQYSRVQKLKASGVDMRNKTINMWDEKYAQLARFKKEHGHLHVCKHFNADKQLINFVKGIRRRKDRISKTRKEQLDKIGFIWNPEKTVTVLLSKERSDNQWLQRFEELKGYKNKFGTCYILTTSKTHKSLANWISVQRNNITNLSPEKISLLNEIGFFTDQKKNNN